MKPDLALHAGLPKTGTTALQSRLAASRAALLGAGWLYPQTETANAHHFLALPLDFANRGPRLMVSRYGRDNGPAVFDRMWTRMLAEIEACRPAGVILSTEYVSSRIGLPGGDMLCERLRETFGNIHVTLYLRQPSKWLTSMLQQTVKYSGLLTQPRPISWRKDIELWESRFPGCVAVRKYERNGLRSGDIAEDFLFHALGREDIPLAPAVQVNETMSAEAALLMQDFQIRHQPDKDDIPTSEKRRFRERLREADRQVTPQAPPKLRADLVRYMDEGSTDLLWLRDHHGIVFDGIDYRRIGRLPTLDREVRLISDAFEIDEKRLALLRQTLKSPRRKKSAADGLWRRFSRMFGIR